MTIIFFRSYFLCESGSTSWKWRNSKLWGIDAKIGPNPPSGLANGRGLTRHGSVTLAKLVHLHSELGTGSTLATLYLISYMHTSES